MILRSTVYEAQRIAIEGLIERLDRVHARLMHPIRRFALDLEDRRLYEIDREHGYPGWVRRGETP